jgi:mannose-6-phosphate isomerase
MLSVQVHPTDAQKDLLPPGERGKTEAWVVLQSDPESSILAGLQPEAKPDDLRHLTSETYSKYLASFNPAVGDTVFLEAGTVHALGGGVVVFEVQQNSDVTFRLFDWDRVDEKTGRTRELHIDQALRCIDFTKGPLGPSQAVIEETSGAKKERLVDCEHFILWRWITSEKVTLGSDGEPRVIMCLSGSGSIRSAGIPYEVQPGQVYMLPSAIGSCEFSPSADCVLFEVGLPR